MKTCEQPIGVFDSGVGGLTVARAIQAQLPNESVIYFGDRARCPYGDQAPQDVLQYAIEISQFLLDKPVKCLVIACNTATAVALTTLQSRFSVPIIGVIKPGASAAFAATKNQHIGVIGTSVTIQSHAYRSAIHALSPGARVVEHACPELVPLVEQGMFEGAYVEHIVQGCMRAFEGTNVDTLVLGCTHYPLLAPVISRLVGSGIAVISSADATASAVAAMLSDQGLVNTSKAAVSHRYFTTGDGSKMRLALANWFAAPVAAEAVVQVTLPLSALPVVEHAVVR